MARRKGRPKGRPKGTTEGQPWANHGPQTRLEEENKREETGERAAGAPSLDDVLSYSRELRHPEDDARRFHAHHAARGWKDSQGRLLTDWRSAFALWAERFHAHARTHPEPVPAAPTAASRAAAAELELLVDLRANVGTWREAGKWASGFDPARVRKGAVARHGRMAGPLVDKIIAELEGAA